MYKRHDHGVLLIKANQKPNFKKTLLALVLAGFVASSSNSYAETTSSDPNEQHSYQIPSSPLGTTIAQFAAKTGLALSFDPALTKGLSSNPISGQYSALSALEKMLEGKGLKIVKRKDGTYTIRKSTNKSISKIEHTKLDTVIVTGEKINRRLQDTLSSVAVATSQDLEEHGDQSLEDVMMRTPGVYMQSGSQNWGIRGVPASGFDDQGPVTLNGAVSVYVDGTLQPHRLVTMNPLPLWDTEQVEIFRGPQSTVQGRNAIAGSVIMKTSDPSYEPELMAQINMGSYDQRGISFLAGGELLEDTIAGRISLDYQESDGYIHNETLDKDAYSHRDFNARGKLLLQPSNRLDILLIASRSEHSMGENALAAVDGDPQYYKIFYDTDAGSSIDQNTVSSKIDFYINDTWSLTSLTSGSWSKYNSLLDFDQTAGTNREVVRAHQQNMLSQELRLGYESDNLRGHIGVYLNRITIDTHDLLNFSGMDILEGKGKTKIDNQALFGELNWDFAPNWQLIAGLRYDHEKNNTKINYLVDAFGLASTTVADESASFNALLPKLGLSYRLAPEHLIGFVVQRGYRAGGVHLRPATAHESYDPEFTTNYELSYRGAWLDNRLRARANLYYADWEDQQVRILDSAGFARIVNAAKSEMYGVELSSDFDLSDNLSLSADAAYNETEYNNFDSDGGDLSGKAFLYAPRYKFNIGATYRYGAQFTANLNVTHQSDSPSRYVTDSNGQVIETRRSDSMTLVNTTLKYKLTKTFSLSAYGKNLFNKEYIAHNQGDDILDVGAPRTFGIILRAEM